MLTYASTPRISPTPNQIAQDAHPWRRCCPTRPTMRTKGANAPAEEPEDGDANADRDGEHGCHRCACGELPIT